MASYGIGVFNFEFWDGPAPNTVIQHIAAHNRPGGNGTAIQLLGNWGDQFEVNLTSHWNNQLSAVVAAETMRNYVGAGWYALKYNDINYTGVTHTGYHVASVDVLQQRSNVLLAGPSYTYVGGCAMVTRWVLIPVGV